MSEFERYAGGKEPRLCVRLPVRPVAIPAELLAATPDTSVRYEYGTTCGVSGSGIAKAADLVEEIHATITRQRQGKFHPDEAAHLLADYQGIDSVALLKRMAGAFKSGRLIVREMGTDLQKDPSESWGRAADILFVSDIDSWLASQAVAYRFPMMEERVQQVRNSDGHTSMATRPRLFQIMFDRLIPTSADFRGGRISDADLLQVGEAAIMASRHSGAEVTAQDILRSAARGEIPLKALVHRRAKVLRDGGGPCINVGHPTDEDVIVAGSIVTLPLLACQQLANTGRASWRVLDGFEIIEPERWRFDDYRLADDEPDLETSLEDCRITGYDLHAVADAFFEDEAGNKLAPAVTQSSRDRITEDGPATITHSTKGRRRDLLDPVIDEAQAKCTNKWDRAAVWLELSLLAKSQRRPFIGSANEGLQYEDGEEVKYLKRSALSKRLARREQEAR